MSAPPDPFGDALAALAVLLARRVAEELRPMLATLGAPGAPAPLSLLTKQACAAALGVSCATIDRYVRTGLVPFVTLGPDGPRRFRLDDVLAALATREVPPKEPPAKRERVVGVRLLSRAAR